MNIAIGNFLDKRFHLWLKFEGSPLEKLRTYTLLGILLSLPSGYGLYRLVYFSLPFLKERWIFFFLVMVFVSGITLPIYAALNKYFFSIRKIFPRTVIRESLVTAILCEVLIWFQIGRVLNSTIIFFSVGGFLAIEVLLRARDTVISKNNYSELSREHEDPKS